MAARSSGPPDADILVVGEAFGKDEKFLGQPFMGTSGSELRRMLQECGIPAGLDGFRIKPEESSVRFTNVFMDQPPQNNLDFWCGKKAEVGGKDYHLPPLSAGKYIKPEYLFHVAALAEEIKSCNPKVIIALGNTACWALLNRTGITKLRGSVFPCELVPGYSVVPTFHPANILREWSNRPIALGDLQKALRLSTEGIEVPRRELWLAPTLGEVREFFDRFIYSVRPRILPFDIETAGGLITCVGFAPSPDRAITVPFYDPAAANGSYWASPADEREAWRMVHGVLTDEQIPKLGQNGLYDIQYLLRAGIQVRPYLHDTMIRHHALYPELSKGLGFMATLYTDEAPWKLLRARNKDNFKIDDE